MKFSLKALDLFPVPVVVKREGKARKFYTNSVCYFHEKLRKGREWLSTEVHMVKNTEFIPNLTVLYVYNLLDFSHF